MQLDPLIFKFYPIGLLSLDPFNWFTNMSYMTVRDISSMIFLWCAHIVAACNCHFIIILRKSKKGNFDQYSSSQIWNHCQWQQQPLHIPPLLFDIVPWCQVLCPKCRWCPLLNRDAYVHQVIDIDVISQARLVELRLRLMWIKT